MLYIRAWRLIDSFATLSQDVELPSGWVNALKWALARELSAEYGKPVSQDIERMYLEALANIKRLNAAGRPMMGNVNELARPGRYNVYTDQGG